VDGDRVAYLGLLREQCEKRGVRVLGYCLMTDHIHLVATPAREDSLNLAWGGRILSTRSTSTGSMAGAGTCDRGGSTRVQWTMRMR